MPSTAPQAPSQQHLIQVVTGDLHNSPCPASHHPAAGVHQTITFVRFLPQVLARALLRGVPTRRSSSRHTPGPLLAGRTPHRFHPRPCRERTCSRATITTPRQQLPILPPVPSTTSTPPITASPRFPKNPATLLPLAVPFPTTSSSTATQTCSAPPPPPRPAMTF